MRRRGFNSYLLYHFRSCKLDYVYRIYRKNDIAKVVNRIFSSDERIELLPVYTVEIDSPTLLEHSFPVARLMRQGNAWEISEGGTFTIAPDFNWAGAEAGIGADVGLSFALGVYNGPAEEAFEGPFFGTNGSFFLGVNRISTLPDSPEAWLDVRFYTTRENTETEITGGLDGSASATLSSITLDETGTCGAND